MAGPRRWQDLRFSRLLVGLMLAPVVPILLSAPVFFYFMQTADDPFPFEWQVAFTVAYVVVAEMWSIITGLLWLYTVTRWRGRLGRLGSLILGAVCSFLFPVLMTFGGALYETDNLGRWMNEAAFMTVMVGLMAVPAGLLGGWVFWRIGVRPEAPPPQELAPIFGP
jgi:hypothetical protein